MTFLQLCQELVRLGGMAGAGGPSSVEGQQGELKRAINFVSIAHEDVLNLHADWAFLWGNDHYDIDPSFSAYPPPPELHIWDERRIYVDGQPLHVIDWEDYTPEQREPGRPEMAVIQPNNHLLIVPTPDREYRLDFDFFKKAEPLAGNDDVPAIPEQYQRVIIGRALMLYGNYEAAEDVKMQGSELYQMYLSKLEQHQLPRRQQTHGRQESMPITVVAE